MTWLAKMCSIILHISEISKMGRFYNEWSFPLFPQLIIIVETAEGRGGWGNFNTFHSTNWNQKVHMIKHMHYCPMRLPINLV